MKSKSKTISQAIDEIEEGAESVTQNFRTRLQHEIHNLEDTLEKITPHLNDLKERASEEAVKAKEQVEDHVQKNPWVSIGIVGLLFFVIGFLFGNRKSGR